MINNNELLYIVDEHDVPVTPVSRQEAFKKGLWRRTAHVWIINSKNQILCQKRSLKKDNSPGMWEPAVAGHLSPGDNYFTGAVREVREETGIPIETHHLNLLKIYKDRKYREYRGIFYCNWEVDANQIKIEEDEVETVKFINLKTVKNYILYQKHEMWVSPEYAKEMFSVLK
ncbi:MAG TPA: NUDIX domain-containing protein [Alphaproteobacteria bacterium]|jgi:isopentenyldiphosphate isomerase|nr:NUDIX domain-containing protein [Alphaproteobacteria bacterium]